MLHILHRKGGGRERQNIQKDICGLIFLQHQFSSAAFELTEQKKFLKFPSLSVNCLDDNCWLFIFGVKQVYLFCFTITFKTYTYNSLTSIQHKVYVFYEKYACECMCFVFSMGPRGTDLPVILLLCCSPISCQLLAMIFLWREGGKGNDRL